MKIKEVLYFDIEMRAFHIYKQYLDILRSYSKDKNNISKYKLNFYIKKDLKLGGKAWSEGFEDNVLINSGVIDNFFDYFYSFSKKESKKFFENIYFSDEDEEEAELSYEFIKFGNNGKYNFFDSKIIDIKIASLLTTFVSRFIITHELGHIFNGHCEFINSKNKSDVKYIPMFEEDNNQTLQSISPLDFRTLEMDADAFATTDNFRNLILLYEGFEEKVDRDLNIKPIKLFYWWSFAIRSNFLITQKITNDEKYSVDKSHLPSTARWILILGSILNIIDSEIYKIDYRPGDNKKKLLQSITDGFVYAETCYNGIFDTNYNCIDETINNENYKHYTLETKRNWEILYTELKEFSKLPLYRSNS